MWHQITHLWFSEVVGRRKAAIIQNQTAGQAMATNRVHRVDKFFQEHPTIANLYTEDPFFQRVVKQQGGAVLVGNKSLQEELRDLGAKCATGGEITQTGLLAERNVPRLTHYDAWGHRIDDLWISPYWERLQEYSAVHGLVATGYQREEFGHLARLAQFTKMYIFYGAGACFSCPLAMTDGAARLLELYGKDQDSQIALTRLLSTDPQRFITSGQHMTERTGGSDLANSETIARLNADGVSYSLSGYKFFTSAVSSEMAIVLAKIVNEDDEPMGKGSRGLSCFRLPLERDSVTHQLKGIVVHRLKDKLGNRAVPTAELEYANCRAYLLGKPGFGVPVISCLFNLTRWQNAVHCVSSMRRVMAMVQSHAQVRSVFGTKLSSKPLHIEILADMELETRAATLLVAHTSVLLGKEECNNCTKEEGSILRLLTPLCKLYTAKQNLYVCSEGIECFGGVGFCEDSDLPRLFRDAQVAPVWEGTTNVLSLDVWRALDKEKSLNLFLKDIKRLCTSSGTMEEAQNAIETACECISVAASACANDKTLLETSAREFAYALSRTFIAALFVAHANGTQEPTDCECALRWIRKHAPLGPRGSHDADHRNLSRQIGLKSRL